MHRLPYLQMELDLATLVPSIRRFGRADDQGLAVFGNAEARTREVLPQFGQCRRVGQSKVHRRSSDVGTCSRRLDRSDEGRQWMWRLIPIKINGQRTVASSAEPICLRLWRVDQ